MGSQKNEEIIDELDSAGNNGAVNVNWGNVNVNYRDGRFEKVVASCKIEDKHLDKSVYFEQLKEENRELKAIKMCYVCKLKEFSFVFDPCSHVVCDICVAMTPCKCQEIIENIYPCILSPRAQCSGKVPL